ncbi:NUDIX hydrolase [Holzapfeliella sp. He02]|uniref:NUDIX hydrolase n=1 Tax=Holzapfeliella saturejae TaxID=3082953 RepID=A0ABU8SHD4_9LACO
MNYEEIELRREQKFQGKIISVDVETVKLPNGQEATREVVRHNGAVSCLAVQNNKALFVKQWREPAKAISVEIPAGKLDSKVEEPLAAIQRELNEETGYQADNWQKIYEFYTSVGFSDEKMSFYYCDSLQKLTHKRSLDEDEFLSVQWLSLKEAEALIENGDITDLKTIMAINYWKTLQVS